MSYALLHHGATTMLAARTPVIKASEAASLATATALLAEVEALSARALVDIEAARTGARDAGRAEGVAEVREEVATRLAALADDLARQQRERDEGLSEAALAAVEAIIGAAGIATVGPALVEQALAAFVSDEPVTVTVAPALAERLRGRLVEPVQVVEDPTLGPLDCELRTARGTIRAGLDVQLGALAERWGVER